MDALVHAALHNALLAIPLALLAAAVVRLGRPAVAHALWLLVLLKLLTPPLIALPVPWPESRPPETDALPAPPVAEVPPSAAEPPPEPEPDVEAAELTRPEPPARPTLPAWQDVVGPVWL